MTMGDNLLKRAMTDQETGLSNSMSLRHELERAIERAERYEFPISLVTVRCEGNDTGLLSGLGRLLGSAVRRSDCLARHGEREFRLMLTHEDASQHARVVERLREVCRDLRRSDPAGRTPACEVMIESSLTTEDYQRLLQGL